MYFLFLVSAFCGVQNFSDINKLNRILKPFLAVYDSMKSVEDELYKFFNNSNVTISLSSDKKNSLEIRFNDPTNNALPECLGRLINIEILILKSNSLNELPDFFEKFTSLFQLSLSSNNFDKLPKVLFSLKNLTLLYLHRNKFKSIENNIKNFKKLTTLTFGDNDIRTVSEELANLTHLTNLSLGGNVNIIRTNENDMDHNKDKDFLKKLPNSVECLYIDNIRLRYIPWDLKLLGNLLILSVMRNLLGDSLCSSAKPIFILGHDKSLKNHKNPTYWIYPLIKLKKLKLSKNKLNSTFFIEEHMLSTLEKLDLTACYITKFEVEGYNIMDSSTSEYIKYKNTLRTNSNLSDNALDKNNSESSIVYSLKYLTITIINTYTVPNLLIFPNLLYLKIEHIKNSYNNVTSDIAISLFDGLLKMKLLERLGLFGFNFINIPKSIFNLKDLQSLLINNCKIKVIPDEIKGLSNLNKINLNYNNITYINPQIFEIKTLMEISLDKNPTSYLPSTINNDNLRFKLKIDGLQTMPLKKDDNNLGIMDISYKKVHQVSVQNCFNIPSISIKDLYEKSHGEEYKWELDQMLRIKHEEVKESQNDYNVIEKYLNILENYITDNGIKYKFSNYIQLLYGIKKGGKEYTGDLIKNIKNYAEAICEILTNLINIGNTKIVEKIVNIIEPGLSGGVIDQVQYFSYAYHLLIGDENESKSIESFIYNRIGLLKYHALREIITSNNEEQNINKFSNCQNRLAETLGLPFIPHKYGINMENNFLKCRKYIIYQFFKLMSVEKVIKDLYKSINKTLERRVMAYKYICDKKDDRTRLKEYVKYRGDRKDLKITSITNKGIYFILKEMSLIKKCEE